MLGTKKTTVTLVSQRTLLQVLQDLRPGIVNSEVVHSYFTVLCKSLVNVNVRHFYPAYAYIMAGLAVDPTEKPHRLFKDRHLFCDWLFYQVWRKVPASRATCSKQDDNDSCGVLACWNAAARVFGIPLQAFHRCHVTLMRLHIFHCFMANSLFVPFLIRRTCTKPITKNMGYIARVSVPDLSLRSNSTSAKIQLLTPYIRTATPIAMSVDSGWDFLMTLETGIN